MKSSHPSPTCRPSPLFPALLALMALAFAGCLSPDEGGDPAADELGFAGYALTADDEADDGFDESTDPQPFLEEMDDAFADDEAPAGDEVDAEALPIPDGPDDESLVVRRTLMVVWGQPIANPDAPAPVKWDGSISSDVAFIKPLRKVRFESGDKLYPDGDPRAVTFSTTTKPHHDGLIVRLIVPKDKIAGGTVTFDTDVFTRTVPLADLLNGYHEMAKVDDDGNIVRADTLPNHPCAHGFVAAQWKRLHAKGGVFGGKWKNADGSEHGYWMGLWGKVDGKNRLKGVYLDDEMNFRGTLKGAYKSFPAALGAEGGTFAAKWHSKDGPVGGVIVGTYTVGEEPGEGTAHGHWLAVCGDAPGACGPSIEPPADAVCECAADASADGSFTSEDGSACTCKVPPAPKCLEAPAPDASGEASTDA